MNGKQDKIKNKAYLTFEVMGKSHTVESNEVEAKRIDVRVIKEESRHIVFEGDKIGYKVFICNDSSLDLFDLDFRDRLDNDIEYERNSFKVNGECKNPDIDSRTVCYHINKLKAKEEIVITFEVEVK